MITKFIIIGLALAMSASFSFAGPLDTSMRAQAVKSTHRTAFFAAGAHSIYVGQCDPLTGTLVSREATYVHCVVLMADGEAFRKLSNQYPVGSKVNGVYVALERSGRPTTQPRGSAGN